MIYCDIVDFGEWFWYIFSSNILHYSGLKYVKIFLHIMNIVFGTKAHLVSVSSVKRACFLLVMLHLNDLKMLEKYFFMFKSLNIL